MLLKPEFNFLLPIKVKNLLRLGRDFDGGYLVCEKTLNKCQNLITLGVGDDISFEIDFFKKKQECNISLYDHTVNDSLFFKIIMKYFRRAITFRVSPKHLMNSIVSYLNYKKFLKKKNVQLFNKKVVQKAETSNEVSLKNILNEVLENKKNLLKVDIEGGEYEIIDQICIENSTIEMLIIEFHWINKKKNIFRECIKKLNSHFKIIHIHANNYKKINQEDYFFDVIELTFINKRNVDLNDPIYRYDFPINDLDQECIRGGSKIDFSFSRTN